MEINITYENRKRMYKSFLLSLVRQNTK